ncbi:fatty acid transporter protein [Aspergillus terreus]|uniref:Fatty acid transporter protein n=1 Tax=Aspergillus terreus TaxID=33178 RepID=A0A5M3YX50_ASPTE|nr:hypothetical protein ATETN484_0003087800 [Aspergillus terreus]GFF14864.1 fatty acid transporter protein [Aspergillus terreus]
MAETLAATALGSLALAGWVDAKFHIRSDLRTLFYGRSQRDAQKCILEKVQQDRLLMYQILEGQVESPATANNVFLISAADGRTWTYREFLQDVNRVGNWLLQELDIQKQELVALDGLNSPEYLIAWFALDSIGAAPCFINHSLTGQSLEHCIKLCEARYCLADEQIKHLVDPVETLDKCNIIYYSQEFFSSLKYPHTPPSPERRRSIPPDSTKILLYTSGTTGFPKAVTKAAAFELYTGRGVARYLGLRSSNRFYTCLPLFHGAAHALCVTPVIHAGCTLILGRKFSHSTFWPEVVTYQADIMQYVGELCRYLVNAKPHPLERKHKLQMAWGNGMRPDVWEPFRQRFGIPMIHELYAASDGMGAMYNPNRGEFSRHAIGTHSRSKDRLCNGMSRGVPGETIHWVDPANPYTQFEGYYKNQEATNKRFIRDVFKKGDMWFRSGDMMRQDSNGCVYFVDRLGDTYRWKSENVSTNEVSDLLGQFPGIAECNVYGVLVPNADGRAGCAAIVFSDGLTADTFDFKGLAEHSLRRMPRYAVPIFLRLTPALGYTTFQQLAHSQFQQHILVYPLEYWRQELLLIAHNNDFELATATWPHSKRNYGRSRGTARFDSWFKGIWTRLQLNIRDTLPAKFLQRGAWDQVYIQAHEQSRYKLQ